MNNVAYNRELEKKNFNYNLEFNLSMKNYNYLKNGISFINYKYFYKFMNKVAYINLVTPFLPTRHRKKKY